MTPQEQLNDDLEVILRSTARFVPMAFHVHSPGSWDWAQRPHAEKSRNARSRFEGEAGTTEFLNELASEFRIVCITDHMKVGYACSLAAASLKRNDIRVFPGMEVNCIIAPAHAQRIHLLVVFPPDKNAAEIERIFAGAQKMPADSERTGNEELKLGSLHDWARQVEAEDGMLIVAHIDDAQRGHRACFRALREDSVRMFLTDKDANILDDQREIAEEYRAHISDSDINAIEIMKPEDRHHFVSVTNSDGRKVRLPCVARFDAHCVEDFASPQKKTFVKVATPEFSAVRDALRFHETRIKFADDLPMQPAPRIIGMRLRSPTGNGLFSDATIAFNPNLSCMIGPRGSGKSTVVEALRYVLGLNSALSDVAGDGARVSLTDIAQGIQQANLQDSLIELVFENREGVRHVLHAAFDPRAVTATEVFELAGDAIPVAPQQLRMQYPVRVYSWSEIENLGRQPQLQRTLLDRLIERLPEYCEERDTLYNSIADNRRAVQGLCTRLNRKLDEDRGILRCFAQYRADFERINTPEVAVLFQTLDEARERLVVISEFADRLTDLRQTVGEVQDVDLLQVSEAILGSTSAPVRKWWEEEATLRVRLLEVTDLTASLGAQVVSRIDEKLNSLAALRAVEAESVRTSEAALRERTQTSPQDELVRGKREQSKARLARATTKRTEYQSILTELRSVLRDRKELIANLEKVQDAISGARQSSLGGLQSSLSKLASAEMAITVAFEAGKDRERAIDFLRDSSFFSVSVFGHYKKSQLAERCAAMASPIRLARCILHRNAAIMTEEGVAIGAEGSLNEGEVQTLIQHFQPVSTDSDADVQIVDSEKLLQLLELQEQRWDDKVRILLNDRPIDELSPGQRSSAMLPLIALSETVPLVIDQPEDNLDNRMVGTTLTRVLAELKERRQIIVATHNPNIVVGGDAEQVVVLEATGARRAVVARSGSIDDGEIIRSVISIMEGGKEAFQARERRYEHELS